MARKDIKRIKWQLASMRGAARIAGARRQLSTRAVRILVLGNGAAGAEKQALALGTRIRARLLAQPNGGRPTTESTRCPPVAFVRLELSHSPLLRALPPTLQVLGARLTQNPLFGYTPLAAKQQLSLPPSYRSTPELQPLQVVIGCGRSTVALCAALKQLAPADGSLFNVQIQHPRVPLDWFDAVIAPRHDFPTAAPPTNVFLTSGTVYDISPELLRQHACEWQSELASKLLSGRHVLWLVGGPCRGFSFSAHAAERMADEFIRGLQPSAHDASETSVLVTFSRRTPMDVQHVLRRRLHAAFPSPGQLLIWTGMEPRNPYYALLATADVVVVTPDSVSMATEAVAAAKPVFTLGVERCSGKFRRFHDALAASGATTPFSRDAMTVVSHSKTKEDVLQAVATTASKALERELDEIIDALVENIQVAESEGAENPLT